MQLVTSGIQMGPYIPVKVLYNGAADALRINQKPLPGIGTHGTVIFPYGDARNGEWLGATYPSGMDAIQSDGTDTAPFVDYESHYSGYWKLLDGLGQLATVFPDGSSFTVGAASGVPVPNRHIVEGNVRSAQPLTQGQRVASVPPPFTLTLGLSATGKLNLTVNGAVPTDFYVLVSKFIAQFNTHTHTDVTPGSSNTGPPTTALTATDVNSNLVNVLS